MRSAGAVFVASPEQRTLYIHIGAHKAGSTSLQLALAQNTYRLHQQGVRHLSAGRQHLVGPHHFIAAAVRDPQKPSSSALLAKLAAEVRNSHEARLIISAEGLEHLRDAAGLAPLAAIKRDHNLKVVVIYLVREHAAQFNSAYVEVVRHLTCSDTFDRYLRARLAIAANRYRAPIELWSSLADRMIVRTFSSAAVEDLFRTEFGLDAPLPHANESINALSVEAFRRLKLSKRLREQEAGGQLRRDNAALLTAVGLRAAEFDHLYPRFWGFDPEQLHAFHEAATPDAAYLQTAFSIAFEKPDRTRSIVAPPYSEEDRERLDYVLRGL